MPAQAVRIALDVKKHLVDQGRLDITQVTAAEFGGELQGHVACQQARGMPADPAMQRVA